MRNFFKKWLFFGTFVGIVGAAMVLPQQQGQNNKVSDPPFQGNRGIMGPPEPKDMPPVAVPIPDDFVRLTINHVNSLSEYDQVYARYLVCMDGDQLDWRSTSLALHYVGRSSDYRLPVSINKFILYIDLRWYAPKSTDIEEWLRFWEELAFDPSFSLLPTKGSNLDIKEDVIRFNSNAINPIAFEHLQTTTHSLAPLVDSRYFKRRVLDSIKGSLSGGKQDAVFKKVFGGLYYEFKGIRLAKEVLGKDTKATDLDLYFEDLGIGNIKGGLNSDQLFNKLTSDQRMVMGKSEITGKVRWISSFNTPAVREGHPWGAITGDIRDSSIDLVDFAFANLENPRSDAREAIFPDRLGFPKFGLFNGDGVRQDFVPQDIAENHLVPRPHRKAFGNGLACIWCHGVESNSRGWQPIVNDVRKLLNADPRLRLDVFNERKNRESRSEIIDRLRGQYNGDFRLHLQRARDDLTVSTLRATTFPGIGPWPGGKGDLTDLVPLAAERLASEHQKYWYDQVDPQQACKELGLKVSKDKALVYLRLLLPPDTRDVRIDRDREEGDILFTPEDPRLALLLQDIPINRTDWSLAYGFAAERSRRSVILQYYRGELPWGVLNR